MLGPDESVPAWAYDAALKAVDEWCDKRWAWWRKDAIAWHTARYILDAQAKVQEMQQKV